jgi:hypothetical protein
LFASGLPRDWASREVLGSLHWPRRSPARRSPKSNDSGSFRRERDPLQSPSPPLDCPTRRSGELPGVFASFNGILARAPCGAGSPNTRPGSALGLSQPLSGFPASSSSTALSHAATVPERSLQSFPLAERTTPLSGPACSLAVIHRRANRAAFAALSPAVSPTPAPHDAVAWFPRRLWVPFPRAEARFPVALDRRMSSAVPPTSPASKPCSRCESVPPRPGEPEPSGRCSPGLRPSRDVPSGPRTLGPARAARTRTPPRPGGLGARRTGP